VSRGVGARASDYRAWRAMALAAAGWSAIPAPLRTRSRGSGAAASVSKTYGGRSAARAGARRAQQCADGRITARLRHANSQHGRISARNVACLTAEGSATEEAVTVV
jgi:hypothetical protein